MKITISVSKDILKLSEQLAKQLNVSRDKIFEMGVKKLGEKFDKEFEKEDITKKLNEFFAENTVELDPLIQRIATRSIERKEW
jgi:lipoate-protein ligase A